MTILAANFAALAIYLAASCILFLAFKRQTPPTKQTLLGLVSLVLVVHGAAILTASVTHNGFQLSLFNASSLIFWMINLLVFISSWKNLYIIYLFYFFHYQPYLWLFH